MQLSYTLTGEDYSRFLYHRTKFSLFYKDQVRLCCVLLSLGLVLLLIYSGRYADPWAIADTVIFGGLVGFIASSLMLRAVIKNYEMEIRNYQINEFIGDRILILTDEEVIERAAGLTIATPYGKIYKIKSYRRYFFIYYDAFTGAIVPHSAFKDIAALTDFINLLRRSSHEIVAHKNKHLI